MNPGGKVLLSVSGGVFLFAVAYPHVLPREATSDDWSLPPRHHVIESLTSPIRVHGWTSEGFITVQGNILPVPGIPLLPAESPVLQEIVHRGVERDSADGRIYGLLPIFHGCGNDPIALHLARVDVAAVIRIAEENPDCNDVKEPGWDARCFYLYEEWMADSVQSK